MNVSQKASYLVHFNIGWGLFGTSKIIVDVINLYRKSISMIIYVFDEILSRPWWIALYQLILRLIGYNICIFMIF